MFQVIINENEVKKGQPSVSKLTCRIDQKQSIILPNLIRKDLNIESGDEVTVSLSEKPAGLVIRKSYGDNLENKMIVGQRGAIRIPTELMRVLRLGIDDLLYVNSSEDSSLIVL